MWEIISSTSFTDGFLFKTDKLLNFSMFFHKNQKKIDFEEKHYIVIQTFDSQ